MRKDISPARFLGAARQWMAKGGKRMQRAWFGCVAGILLAVPLQAAPLDGLDARIEQSLGEWQVPGLSLAVVKDDQVVKARGYGVRRFGRREKVDERTLFAIGSTTKAFAAATIAVLVSDGAMDWDAPVKQFLPWLEVYDPAVTRQLTVRDMLSGTLGSSYIDEHQLRAYSKNPRDILERGQFVRPRAAFRSGFVYSNNMFIAAGQTVAAVSGKTWAEFARERLWQPLGMSGTNADSAKAWATGNAASGHGWRMDRDPEPSPSYEYCDTVCIPSGGINSNAADMAQWLRFQLGEGTFGGKVLVRPEVFREMHQPQAIMRPVEHALGLYLPLPKSSFTELERWGVRSPAYGFGWATFEYRGRRVVWHEGGANDTATILMLVPAESLGVFVSMNRRGPSAKLKRAVAWQIIDTYLGGQTRDWNEVFLADMRKEWQETK